MYQRPHSLLGESQPSDSAKAKAVARFWHRMKLALITILTAAAAFAEVKVVELTETQKAAYARASEALKNAQAEYDRTVRGIKAAHGAYQHPYGFAFSTCNQTDVSGEIIDGRLILIRTTSRNVCGFTMEAEPKPIK